MKKSYKTFTPEQVARAKRDGFTVNGIAMDETYYHDGVSIVLMREEGITLKQLLEADKQLKQDRDLIQPVRWGSVIAE